MFDTIVHRWLRAPYTLYVRQSRKASPGSMTYLFVHGLGDTGAFWDKLVGKIPENTGYIVVDLLGFGNSPRPSWSEYNADAQARSLLATYRKLHIKGPVTFVGHSLGALVCVEAAKRYKRVQQLVLCSPPIYGNSTTVATRKLLSTDAVLRGVYHVAIKDPKRVVEAYAVGQRLKLIGPTMVVTDKTIHAFLTSLHASILNQKTVDDIGQIKNPITIINGHLDPFTVMKTLRRIAREHDNIALKTIPVGHGLNALYQKTILQTLGVPTRPRDKKA